MLDPLSLETLRKASESFVPPLPLWSVLDHLGGLHLAVGFTSLFWPRLVEFHGDVFLAEGFSAEVYELWLAEKSLTSQDRQRVMNEVHLWDLFGCHEDQREEECYIVLGRVMRSTWQALLGEQYPERSFEVIFDDGSRSGTDAYGPQLTFFEK